MRAGQQMAVVAPHLTALVKKSVVKLQAACRADQVPVALRRQCGFVGVKVGGHGHGADRRHAATAQKNSRKKAVADGRQRCKAMAP